MSERKDQPFIVTGNHALEKRQVAHAMRRQMTPCEKLLWDRIRGSRVAGLHFRRQQVIRGFIVDFYCHVAQIVIEVDGSIHEEQVAYDAERDSILTAAGLRVLRFSNDQVTFSLNAVLQAIVSAARQLSNAVLANVTSSLPSEGRVASPSETG